MSAEELLRRMKKLETKIYRDFSEFVEDLNLVKMCVKKIYPVEDFTSFRSYSNAKCVKIEIENKKYIAEITRKCEPTIIYYYYRSEPEPPRH